MPLRRKKTSGILVFIWMILFSCGLGIVFLLLGGYRISLEEKDLHRLGFVDFSAENSTLYANGYSIGQNTFFDVLPLGEYTFCAKNFLYFSRCFPSREVQENSFPRLDLHNIFLQKKFQFPQKITEEKVYFHPEGLGVLWFDKELKSVFWGDAESGNIFAKIPEKQIKSISWNAFEDSYLLLFVDGTTEYFNPFSRKIFGNLSLLEKKKKFLYENRYIQIEPIEGKGIEKKEENILFASFDIPAQKKFPIPNSDAYLYVFPSSVYLFLETDRQMKKIIQKDENTPIVFSEKKKEIFFQYRGMLWKQEL